MNNLFDQIKILKSNKHYRLGDLILCQGLRWQHDREIILNNEQFEGSFLRAYLESCEPIHVIDKITLVNLVNQFANNLQLNENTLYINIRLGDSVMEPFGAISGPKTYGLLNELFLYYPDKLLNTVECALIQNPLISDIQFVTALHFGDNEKNNMWRFSQEAVDENRRRFEQIIELIQKKFNNPVGIYKFPENVIKHIDNDFLTLCTAKNVVLETSPQNVNGGHFGKLIAMVRNLINDDAQFI
jgi:hypothetical protein